MIVLTRNMSWDKAVMKWFHFPLINNTCVKSAMTVAFPSSKRRTVRLEKQFACSLGQVALPSCLHAIIAESFQVKVMTNAAMLLDMESFLMFHGNLIYQLLLLSITIRLIFWNKCIGKKRDDAEKYFSKKKKKFFFQQKFTKIKAQEPVKEEGYWVR